MSDNLWVNFLGYKVKAMIHPIVSIAAFFVDQLSQAPVQIQCVQQTAATPEWKWWMSALAPWIGPLLSGVVSIYVAWRVFHWQGEKDRKQWIRDQKMAEWRELLGKANEVHSVFLRAESPNPIVSMNTLMEDLPSARLGLKECWSRCLFVSDVLKTKENGEIHQAFDKKLDEGERSIRGSGIARRALVPIAEPIPENFIVNQTLFDKEVATYNELKAADNSFQSWILSVAKDDLDT
jgi:hypothetical protein